jgi:acetyl-CoA C-acetyltransferase
VPAFHPQENKVTEAVIVATARTPIGRAKKGSLVEHRADDLSAFVIESLLKKVPGLDPDTIEDIIWGCGQPAGESGYNLARVVAVLAGLTNVPGVTVNRYCSSSLMSIRIAAHAIRAGEGDAFIAGGVETVSRFRHGLADDGPHNPLFADAMRRAEQTPLSQPWQPSSGLPAMYEGMLLTAENVASYKGVSRQAQDEFAARSQQLAVANQDNGFWAEEITPVSLGNGTTMLRDDGPRAGTTVEKLNALEPIVDGGTVTAGNACPLNDGAAAVVVMSDRHARDLGLTPLARIVSSGVSALDPEIMGMGPVEAIRQALARAGKTVADIDLFEINEAFAAQVLPSAGELGIPIDKLNVKGGAIALGHPYGMTGARIMTTLIHSLQSDDKTWGVESMCVGGGQGMAMVIERLS